MDTDSVRGWLEEHGEFSYSRSSGPGGQNVNKVSSKTTLRFNLSQLQGITEEEKLRLADKLQAKLTVDGEIVIQVQDERSQLLNRGLALERALKLITVALHRDKPRRKTRPTRNSQERRLLKKRIVGRVKSDRRAPETE